jgi:four helix bundle protein
VKREAGRSRRKHHDLLAWQLATQLTKQVYLITQSFSASEMYGLVSQMRRCAVSVPSNIAEGAARDSDKEFAHFLTIARGSMSELDTQLYISEALDLMAPNPELDELMDRVFALIGGLLKTLRTGHASG